MQRQIVPILAIATLVGGYSQTSAPPTIEQQLSPGNLKHDKIKIDLGWHEVAPF
jgi:hypothetical protein